MPRLPLAAIAGLLALLSVLPATGHEGHDHDNRPPLNLPVAPRVVAVTPEFELVGVSSGKDRLTVFLHTFATNEPVKGARMTVSAAGNSADATPEGDAVFTLSAPWLAEAAKLDLLFALTLADGSQDLLTGRLQSLAAAQADTATLTPGTPWWPFLQVRQRPELAMAAAGGLMAGILMTLLLVAPGARRHSRDAAAEAARPVSIGTSASEDDTKPRLRGIGVGIALTSAALLLAQIAPAIAAGLKNAELPSVPSTMATDQAQRTPDGTLFVPKATQHLLSVRTMLTTRGIASRTVELTGTIVPGPEHFGRVQPGRPGRIEAAAGGLAYIGKRVEKGDLLAYVLTYIEAADRATIDSQVAETEARIEKNRTILSRYEKVPGAIPPVKVDEVRGELAALIRKRAELLPSLASREPILAPIGGVVSVANATIGQVVEARDVLFEIVDPAQFWVEAHGYGHETQTLQTLKAAYAVVPGGGRVSLELAGRGLALRHQATVTTFKISGLQEGIAIGMPVKVVLQSQVEVDGFVLPAAAIVRGQTGLPIVWVKTEPERFEPRVVKVAPLDGQSVVVTSGLKQDQRVVTDGVTLLNQVR